MNLLQDELENALSLARKLSQEPGLVPAGGIVSAKGTGQDIFGEAQELLLIMEGKQPLATVEAEGFARLRLEGLARLAGLENLSEGQLQDELLTRRAEAASPEPPQNTLIFVLIPETYVCLTTPEALLAIERAVDGPARLGQLFGASVLVAPYARSGLPLARALAQALWAANDLALEGIVLVGHGLLTFGEKADIAYARAINLAERAEAYLQERRAWEIEAAEAPAPEQPVRAELAALRRGISSLAGFPLLLAVQSEATPCFEDVGRLEACFPALPEQAQEIKPFPLAGRNLEAYRAKYEAHFRAGSTGRRLEMADPAPRVLLDPELGLLAAGRTAREMDYAAGLARLAMRTIWRADALGGCAPFAPDLLIEAEYGPAGPAPHATSPKTEMFQGEAALVTGGASGIGKACVESLLARGAAVATMDINPAVEGLFDRPDFLGLHCDLTDEGATLAAFEALGRRFGGLDMLILNAGIFPAGVRIEALSLEEWQRVMRINLDPNLVVLREAYPLLKCSPRGGRVLVNASKNVLAPGAGAAAYSSSKAAVTQMARVAALEWGKDRIRVNMIHPDAIFDTGIWTEEVLKARAAHYGMTVQQYKTRNVLGVELNSHFVGELAAEMLGPLFEKITGAQIPVDGGSDRVI